MIPFLQQHVSSRTDAWVVSSSYLHGIPVVVPRNDAVQHCEDEGGQLTISFHLKSAR